MIYAKYHNKMTTITERYHKWLQLREKNEDEYGYKLCYCGHTNRCECADPDLEMFTHHIKHGNIKENDPRNGWKLYKPKQQNDPSKD